MKTTLEHINEVEKLVNVTLEWDEISVEYDKLCKKLRKNYKMDGFRPGKVPMALAKKHLAPKIQYDFINQMIKKYFDEAIKDTDLKEYVGTSLEDVKFNENEPMVFDIKVEVDPELVLPTYKDGFTVKKKNYIVDDTVFEQYLEIAKREHAEVEKIDGEVESGHFVTCNLIKEDQTKEEGVKWEVGEEPLTGDVEKEFIGKKSGDEFETELSIKENRAKYKVTIQNIQKHAYPTIDDEWVKGNIASVESLEAWKKQTLDAFRKESEVRVKHEFESNIKNWFKENMEIELPKTRIENYLDGMVEQYKAQQGGNLDIDPATLKQFYRPQAEESVRWFLIEEKIKEDEGIAITSEDFDAKVEENLATYPEDQREQYRSIFNNEQYKKQMELQLFSDKIMAHIQEFVSEDVEDVKPNEIFKK